MEPLISVHRPPNRNLETAECGEFFCQFIPQFFLCTNLKSRCIQCGDLGSSINKLCGENDKND